MHSNAVLLYLALQHKKLAIYADVGIYARVDKGLWDIALHKMQEHFKKENFANGIIDAIKIIGDELAEHFPEDGETMKNSLPDELAFGKN